MMASDFKIAIQRNDENLHLRLIGDFDGSSACELINDLKKNSYGIRSVFIHTACLNRIHPIGREVLRKNLRSEIGKSIRIIFTGDKASQLVTESDRNISILS